MSQRTCLYLVLAGLVAVWGSCSPPGDTQDGSTADGDADTDGDVDGDTDVDVDADSDTDYTITDPEGCTKVDLLFVVDDSLSMEEEQSNLALNFPRFIDALEAYRTPAGTQLSYRVGVTSTTRAGFSFDGTVTIKRGGRACVPDDECPQDNQNCECPTSSFAACSAECSGNCFCEAPFQTMPVPPETCSGENGALMPPGGYTEPWIEGPGDHVAAAFQDAATIGVDGCSVEMPLYAAEHALSPDFEGGPTGANAGFLRHDALLMVIVLTDEDDCSTDASSYHFDSAMDIMHPLDSAPQGDSCTDGDGNDLPGEWIPVEHYIEFFDGLMGGRNHWTLAVIAGLTGCSDTAYGDASQAFRLQRLVDQAGNGVFEDICQADLAGALERALDRLQIACDDYILI